MISSLAGCNGRSCYTPGKVFLHLSRICNLPARIIRVLGELCRICFSSSSSSAVYSVMHSSSASMHMKVGREDEISCSISTTWPSSSLRPSVVFLWSRKASTTCSGTVSGVTTTSFRRELSSVVGDCSFWAAKSK